MREILAYIALDGITCPTLEKMLVDIYNENRVLYFVQSQSAGTRTSTRPGG
jgi:hypothetical protein